MEPKSLLFKTDAYRLPSLNEKHLIPRPRLVSLLDEVLEKPCCVVHAAAGYGKTTAVALWCKRRKINAAWMRLDASDAMPERFVERFAQACRLLGGDTSKARQCVARLQDDELGMFRVLDEALAQLSSLHDDACIILDDWHMLSARKGPFEATRGFFEEKSPNTVYDLVEWIVGRLPEEAHLIVLSRSFPHAGLARLALDGRLLDIGQECLAFSRLDTASFCQIEGFELTSEQIDEVNERTSGWPMAHALFAQAATLPSGRESGPLCQRIEASSFWKSFYRLVFDYLYDETLRKMPGHVATFAMAAACLDEANESLMASVLRWSHEDAAFCMAELEEFELFSESRIDELGQVCYTVSPLVKNAIRGRGILRSEFRYADIMSRAASWYLRKEDYDRSIRCAAAAQNWDFAADVALQRWNDLIADDDYETIRSWIDLLPSSYLKSRPKLCAAAAMPYFLAGRQEYAFSLLKCAEDAIKPDEETLLGFIHVIRGLCLSYIDLESAAHDCELALRYLPESEQHFRAMALQVIGGRQVFAHPNKALVNLVKSAESLQCTGYRSPTTSAYANATSAAFNSGNIALARKFAQMARRTVEAPDGPGSFMIVMSDADEAYCDLLVGDYRTARTKESGLSPRLNTTHTPFTLAIAHLLKASLAWLDGSQNEELEAARAAFDASTAWCLRAFPPLTLLARWHQEGVFSLTEASAQLQAQDSSPIGEFLWTLAQASAQAVPTDALYHQANQLASKLESPMGAISAEILSCHLAEEFGEKELAEKHAAHAFELAEAQGITWPFLADGDLIRKPWGRVANKNRTGFAARLLKTLPSAPALRDPGALSKLSDRELDVLKLAAEGLSTQTIADQLLISRDTAKKHLGNAYGKLGVHSRTQAIAALRQAGML